MANFPTYNSGQNIQAGPVAPELHMAAQPYEDIKGVVDTAQKITEHLSHANDVMQETKLKNYYETAHVQAETAAANDPNPDNAEYHIKNLQKIEDNAPKIDNQEVGAIAKMEMKQATFISGIKIQDEFKKKQMLANDMKLDSLATTAAYNKANAVSPAAGMQDEANFMDTISKNMSAGLITAPRAEQLIRSYKLGVLKNNLGKDTAKNIGESQTYKDLNDNKYDLDLKEQESAMNMIKSKIKENKEIDVGQTMGNRVSVIKGIASGELAWQNADQISKVAEKDPRLGEALQAVFKANADGGEYAPEQDQNQHFADLVNKFFSSKTKEQVNNYLIESLNSSANRNMSRDRLAILVNAAEKRGALLPTTNESSDGLDDPNQQTIDNSVKHLQEFVKDNPKSENVFVHFFKGLFGGGSPDQAKDAAIKGYNVKQYPWIGNLPKEGAIYRDKETGAKRRIFPDGSFKEEK